MAVTTWEPGYHAGGCAWKRRVTSREAGLPLPETASMDVDNMHGRRNVMVLLMQLSTGVYTMCARAHRVFRVLINSASIQGISTEL